MKKTLFILAAAGMALLFSCNKDAEKMALSQQQFRDSIDAVVAAKDAEIEMLFQQLNEIETNLATISTKYRSVDKMKNQSGEVSSDTRTRISEQIQDINEMLSQNKAKIASLNGKIAKEGKQTKQLNEFVAKLEARITEQEQQIQSLTEELQQKKMVIENLNKNLDELTKQNQLQEEMIVREQESKNTAYYVMGSKSELLEQHIIDRKGGFIGIGRKTVVNSDASLEKFNKIDIRSVSEIPLTGAKIQILTSHPSSSYQLEGDPKRPSALKILNPSSFWQQSKFLIIILD